MAVLHPLFLCLEKRDVLVVGAGAVAERKIADLLAAGACVRVVAPEATARVQELARAKRVAWQARALRAADLDGAWLAIAATSDPRAQRLARAAADRRRVFLVAVDDVANATAYAGSIVRRGGFTVAISSSGQTPALTRLFREVLEEALPAEDWARAARAMRARWKRDGTPMADRFGELVRAFAARAAKQRVSPPRAPAKKRPRRRP
jgi:siroheme synthase-like protein